MRRKRNKITHYDKDIHIRINETVLDKMKQEAEQKGITLALLSRQIIESHYQNNIDTSNSVGGTAITREVINNGSANTVRTIISLTPEQMRQLSEQAVITQRPLNMNTEIGIDTRLWNQLNSREWDEVAYRNYVEGTWRE